MLVVAGPPGGGKSKAFPVSSFGIDYFNADDEAATLNKGSYVAIPREIRVRVNARFEAFILDHIRMRSSFAFETTLRSDITFRHADLAKQAGMTVEMRYVALRNFPMHLERVEIRSDAGGHSAPASLLESIYRSSLSNLPRAIREMDFITIYDNSRWGLTPAVLLQAEAGEILYLADEVPDWLTQMLTW
jgi:predicted ABC-type ATPase